MGGNTKGADCVATEQLETTEGSLGTSERGAGDANAVSVSERASGDRREPRAEATREHRTDPSGRGLSGMVSSKDKNQRWRALSGTVSVS